MGHRCDDELPVPQFGAAVAGASEAGWETELPPIHSACDGDYEQRRQAWIAKNVHAIQDLIFRVNQVLMSWIEEIGKRPCDNAAKALKASVVAMETPSTLRLTGSAGKSIVFTPVTKTPILCIQERLPDTLYFPYRWEVDKDLVVTKRGFVGVMVP
jgi:hypothetical protein